MHSSQMSEAIATVSKILLKGWNISRVNDSYVKAGKYQKPTIHDANKTIC